MLAINAASAALTASDVIWAGPVAAVRVVLTSEGEPPLVNPHLGSCVAPLLSLTVAGTEDRILMLEAQVQLPLRTRVSSCRWRLSAVLPSHKYVDQSRLLLRCFVSVNLVGAENDMIVVELAYIYLMLCIQCWPVFSQA